MERKGEEEREVEGRERQGKVEEWVCKRKGAREIKERGREGESHHQPTTQFYPLPSLPLPTSTDRGRGWSRERGL